ncbi:PD40 domain-containing protein [Thalassotalea sp. Y01]|uniref:PD40 domain-containing protein n=1 Tax=Thalassotalea sp. Y01 TaxID=2729613 RepID=UPI00145E00D0|nr:PD40 domain-containing protein [Thalassotalea sp. Y01]NMP16594.1 hypothetical protein [Thalassotalea sp. Y01]
MSHSPFPAVNKIPNHIARLALLPIAIFSAATLAVEDDVYLAELTNNTVSSVINVTNRPGYDNQPHFSEDGKALLFTSMYPVSDKLTDKDAEKVQTDSMRYQIDSAAISNLTNSSASEYSPTITPDGKHFSVIRVGNDGRQLLHRYPYKSAADNAELQGETILKDVFDVGYHVWLNQDELLLFVLGEPMMLQRASVETGKTAMIDTDIGRTLRALPETVASTPQFSYTKAKSDRWQLKVYQADTKTVTEHSMLPGHNMYYAWHPDGSLLSASEAKVMVNRQWQHKDEWQLFADFGEQCQGNITRMVVSDDSSKLAFVCSVPAAKPKK